MPTLTVQTYDPKKLSADLVVFFLPSDRKQFDAGVAGIQKL